MADIEKTKANPPYLAFSTFLNAITGLAEHGVPDQIDKSIFGNMSGSDKYGLMAALNFLDLVDADGKPTKDLKTIATGTAEERKAAIGKVLTAKYPRALKSIATGTPDSLLKNFDYETGQAVTQKCVRFFLNAAKEAGVTVSAHILKAGVSGGAPRKKRTVSAATERERGPRDDGAVGGNEGGAPKNPAAPLKMDGLTTMPVPVGLNKTWYVAIDEGYTDEDLVKFTNMIELSLLKKPKK